MSYILEALKKSQQERELGQVPRLQAPMLDEPQEPTRAQSWVFAALGLASLAVMLALYAALQSSRPASEPMEASLGLGAQVDQAPGGDAQPPAGETESSVPASSAPADAVTAAAEPAAPLSLDDPVDLSVEPQVLVVPAPPKPGERLPRGADELRRAVLGAEAPPSIEPRRAEPPRPPPAPEFAPVPPELIAEIEDFKRTYQQGIGPPTGGSADSGTGEQRLAAAAPRSNPAAPAKPVSSDAGSGARSGAGANAMPDGAASSSAKPAPLSGALRRQLPPLSMTVHVYDDEPSRRFIYLNGSKVREGELTRDGFFVEQVLADGAIVRYDEHRFFQSP